MLEKLCWEAPSCPSSRTSDAFRGKYQTLRSLRSVASFVAQGPDGQPGIGLQHREDRVRARPAQGPGEWPGRRWGRPVSSRIGPREAGAPAPHWPSACGVGPPPAQRSSSGSRASGARGVPASRRARLSRVSAPAPGAAELGLISAGSWWPVRARAPRPNSMAIVRRPLCSGGGHFLRGPAGAGGRKLSEPRPRRRGRPSLGSEAMATPLGRSGVGAQSQRRE